MPLQAAYSIQSLMAFWFHIQFGVESGGFRQHILRRKHSGGDFSATGGSTCKKISVFINTMVFTHIPSNILLMMVPLMPTLPLAIANLLLRFSISQMDVPTRQSYTMAVVAPDERSAASGVTGIARSLGASISPALTGWLISIRSV